MSKNIYLTEEQKLYVQENKDKNDYENSKEILISDLIDMMVSDEMNKCKSCNTKFTEAELHYRGFDPSFNFYNFLFKSHCTKCIEQCKIKFTVEDMDKFNPKLFDTVKDDPEKMKY